MAAIEALIRRKDPWPIIAIERMPPVTNRQNVKSAPFKAVTGVGCHGHLSGHGGMFYLGNTAGGWTIMSEGSWVS